jgi:hypothetical protein
MPARVRDGKLFNAKTIRDTTAAVSEDIDAATVGPVLLVAENTHNQALTLTYQGSMDGVTWHDLGSDITLSATTGKNVQTLTDLWRHLRAEVTASVAPASGTVTIYWVNREAA